jgi:hypothetical protein
MGGGTKKPWGQCTHGSRCELCSQLKRGTSVARMHTPQSVQKACCQSSLLPPFQVRNDVTWPQYTCFFRVVNVSQAVCLTRILKRLRAILP